MKKSYLMLLLVAMFALVACDNNDNKPQRSEYDIAIDNLMAQCKDFDAEILTQGLVGEWKEDSFLSYDDEWKTITSAWYIMGDMNCVGLSPSDYSFTADGKGAARCTPMNPPFEEVVRYFDWQYDADSGKLILSYEGYSVQRTVSGFNGEYIVLDYYDSVNEDNKRMILKKK
jgi:hypothetical protein